MPNRAVVLGDGLQSIPASGFMLSGAIQSARTNFGVDKVNLISHSKGGLISRWALDNSAASNVERLVTLGSPHHGIDPVRLWIAKLNNCVIHGHSNALVPDDCQDSADEVSVDRIRDLNYVGCQMQSIAAGLPVYSGCIRIANPQGDVVYSSIVGDADMFVDNASSTYPWNASAAPYPWAPNIDLTLPGRGHYTLKGGRSELDCTMGFVYPSKYGCDAGPMRQATAKQDAQASPMSQLLGISNVVTNALSLTLPITIDSATTVKLALVTDTPLDFHVRSPSGQTVGTSGSNSAQYRSAQGTADSADSWLQEYSLTAPVSGIWQMEIHAPATSTLPLGFIAYATSNAATTSFIRKLANKPRFDLLPRPRRFAQKS